LTTQFESLFVFLYLPNGEQRHSLQYSNINKIVDLHNENYQNSIPVKSIVAELLITYTSLSGMKGGYTLLWRSIVCLSELLNTYRS
jgi:hypothetical protein